MDISAITNDLYVGTQPGAVHAQELGALNIGLIINMRGGHRLHAVYGAPPFNSLWLRTFDFPFTPIRMRTLERGVQAALPVIARGQRVLVHCHRGRHRSVAMAAAILIAQGYTARDAMRLLREKRAIADPHIWYIRRQIELFERYWHKRNPTHDTA